MISLSGSILGITNLCIYYIKLYNWQASMKPCILGGFYDLTKLSGLQYIKLCNCQASQHLTLSD